MIAARRSKLLFALGLITVLVLSFSTCRFLGFVASGKLTSRGGASRTDSVFVEIGTSDGVFSREHNPSVPDRWSYTSVDLNGKVELFDCSIDASGQLTVMNGNSVATVDLKEKIGKRISVKLDGNDLRVEFDLND